MRLTIELPDDVVRNLRNLNGADPTRALLELVALEGYRSGDLTDAQVRQLLGFDTRVEVDAFLKAHGVMLPYTLEDFEEDRETHQRLGL